MKLWFISLFLLLIFSQSSSASIVNCSFTGTGQMFSNTLEQHGIFDGETVSYNGIYVIDTDLIAIDYVLFQDGLVTDIRGIGEFVVSGAITVNDIILPVIPESNASLYFSLNSISSSNSYGPHLSFDVLSPITGDVFRQNFIATHSTADFNTDNYFDQDDIFLQPLLSWKRSTPYLYSDGLDVGGNGGLQNFVQYPSTAPVPEPGTMLLFGVGLAGLVSTSLKRKRK